MNIKTAVFILLVLTMILGFCIGFYVGFYDCVAQKIFVSCGQEVFFDGLR